MLESKQIPYDKKSKKSVLEDLCTELIPDEAKERFGQTLYVTIPTKFTPTNIHYYLHRKYDFTEYYDCDMNVQRIALLNTDLPEDAITEQLKKRGYYKK